MIVVVNTIQVQTGAGDGVAERFKVPKSVHTFPGFIRMEVLRTRGIEEYEEIKVCTTWENEEAFHAWANSDSFKHAHAKRAETPASGNEAVLGNKVTIHDIEVTHLPASSAAV